MVFHLFGRSVAADVKAPDEAEAKKLAGKRAIFENLFAHLSEHVEIGPKWTVAEFGIGRIGFGSFYKEHCARVIGIDVVDFSENHPDLEFVLSNGTDIPLPDECCHAVVSHSVLEHVGDLEKSIAEIDRITRPGGILFLTVNPLYYSAYGAHLHDTDGVRLENWEHLDPTSPHYMTRDPNWVSDGAGHALNMLTSERFLAAVGRVPWTILNYRLDFERKPAPPHVDQRRDIEMLLRGFRFIGRKERIPHLTPRHRA